MDDYGDALEDMSAPDEDSAAKQDEGASSAPAVPSAQEIEAMVAAAVAKRMAEMQPASAPAVPTTEPPKTHTPASMMLELLRSQGYNDAEAQRVLDGASLDHLRGQFPDSPELTRHIERARAEASLMESMRQGRSAADERVAKLEQEIASLRGEMAYPGKVDGFKREIAQLVERKADSVRGWTSMAPTAIANEGVQAAIAELLARDKGDVVQMILPAFEALANSMRPAEPRHMRPDPALARAGQEVDFNDPASVERFVERMSLASRKVN